MQNDSDELQHDENPIDTEIEQVDEVEVDDEQPSDSEPDSDTEHEAKGGEELDDFSKDKVNERFGELTRKRREAERLAKERGEELQKLQSQILESQEPVIPQLPDPDEVSQREFNEAIERRDKAIQDKVNWQQQKQQFTYQQNQAQQQSQMEQTQNLQTAASNYQKNAAKLGVSSEDLVAASQIINQVGLNDDVAMHILQDDLGAAITKHLGNNVNDLLEVANSDPIRAALYIERNIKPKLSPAKRKSNAPRPPSKLKGGTPNRRESFPLTGGRATFE